MEPMDLGLQKRIKISGLIHYKTFGHFMFTLFSGLNFRTLRDFLSFVSLIILELKVGTCKGKVSAITKLEGSRVCLVFEY